jgi:hypothetical protein
VTPEQAAFICVEHGWMSHTFLHEAAHAVMAIDRGIPFERIAVGTPEYFDTFHPDGQVAGGLYVTPPRRHGWLRIPSQHWRWFWQAKLWRMALSAITWKAATPVT